MKQAILANLATPKGHGGCPPHGHAANHPENIAARRKAEAEAAASMAMAAATDKSKDKGDK